MGWQGLKRSYLDWNTYCHELSERVALIYRVTKVHEQISFPSYITAGFTEAMWPRLLSLPLLWRLLPRMLTEATRQPWAGRRRSPEGGPYSSGSVSTSRMMTPRPDRPLRAFFGSLEVSHWWCLLYCSSHRVCSGLGSTLQGLGLCVSYLHGCPHVLCPVW